jgi:outer membrane protein OmpA-like peptidoglycan-associated protein
MSLRAIFLLIFTLLYGVTGHWLYTHKIAGICSGGETVAVVPPVDDPPDDGLTTNTTSVEPLTFNWSDRTPITSEGFDKYQADIVDQLENDKDLEITGYYFLGEVIPDGFENIGKARADALRKMFKDFIGEDRIIINSKLVDDLDGAEFNPFEAAEFNWVTRSRVDDTTIREFDINNIRINFTFNSSNKEESKEMVDYLPELAEHLRATGKSTLIVGHTDSTGDLGYNYDLGLQRAIKIRNLLGKYGADKSKISVDSKGERYPIASNRTGEGEHKNRRVEITLK